MNCSNIDPEPELPLGSEGPDIVVPPPGPESRAWLARALGVAAPMAAPPAHAERESPPPGPIVYAAARGSNVVDVDGNRYVDLAAGFGALLLGHGHAAVVRAVSRQSERLLQALGDVHPSNLKVALAERLSALHPAQGARAILGQSGADAITAALKTAMLYTGRPGVVAFQGAYHGLSYAPLAVCGLRAGYREPFLAQLNPAGRFVAYPTAPSDLAAILSQVERQLAVGDVGAVLVEPILGRGGCVVPPPSFLPELGQLAHAHGALLVVDEIWTGLGRAGRWLRSEPTANLADLICLGKGLGGGLPISACVGTEQVMQAWQRKPEVIHTSTFAGAPLACAAALATLEAIDADGLVERSAACGDRWIAALRERLQIVPAVQVRGAGLMVGIDLTRHSVPAVRVAAELLRRGYIITTGGGARETIVLSPALNVAESQLHAFTAELACLLRRSG